MLDVVNIAHPAFVMLGSFIAYIVNTHFGVDPVAVLAMREVELLLFRGRDEEGVHGLDAMAAPQVISIGRRGDHRRDGDDREDDDDLDQGEAGGGASFRHDVLTGSPA